MTFSLVFKIINSMVGLVSSIFVARYMGAEALGTLAACLAFVALFNVFGDFGFGIAHFKRVSEGCDLGKCIGLYSRIRLVLALLTAAITWTGYHLIYSLTGEYPIDFNYYSFFMIILVSTTLNRFFDFIKMTFSARMEVIKGSVVELTSRLVNVFFKSVVAISGLAIIYLAWANLASTIIAIFVAIFLFRNYPIKGFDKEMFKSYLTFALPLTFVNIVSIISLNIDKVFISYFVSLEEVGYYTVAQSLTQMIIFSAGIIVNLLIPTYTRILSQGTQEELNAFALKVEKYLALIIFPSVFFLFFNAQDIIYFIYGKDFSASVIIFKILVLHSLLFMIKQPYSTQLTAMERLKAIVYIGVTSQVLNIILNFLLIPDQIGEIKLFGLGAAGSAISLFISILTALILYRAYLLINTGFKLNLLIFVYFFIAISSTMIPAYLINSFEYASVLKLTISFVFSTLLYIGTLWVFRLIDSNDIIFYRDFVKISSNIKYFKSEFSNDTSK